MNWKHIVRMILTVVLLFSSLFSNAQDYIYTTDGRELKVIIIEIEEERVKYKNYDQPGGPIRNFSKEFIDHIMFYDGTIERFVNFQRQDAVSSRHMTYLPYEADPLKDADREALLYVTRKLEQSRSVASAGITMTWISLAATLFDLGSLLTSGTAPIMDALGESYYPVVGIAGLGGLGIYYYGGIRAGHFAARKSEIEKKISRTSFIVIPPSNDFSAESGTGKAWQLGIRIRI